MPTPVIEPVLPKPDDRNRVPVGPDNIIPNDSQKTNPGTPTPAPDSNSDDEDSGGGFFFWFFFFCVCIVAAYFFRRR
tara:strand:- start:169 stop:399 length:231 start_codon:yes stop_codon:yes gene_type:complete